MAVETCLKLPPNFAQREEVRRFAMRLLAQQEHFEMYQAHHLAVMLMFDFGAQEKEFRPDSEMSFAPLFAEFSGWSAMTDLPGGLLVQLLLESGLLAKEERMGVEGLTCPLFSQWNPHLLPGFESMHHKGARAAQRKRELAQDRDTADAHLQMFERQSLLNLGELDAGTTKEEIAAALCLIMRIDRAGGCSTRASSGYELWMIAAAVRFMQGAVKDVELLCDFLLEARIDPTVPKGAERVLPELEKLLLRAKEIAA